MTMVTKEVATTTTTTNSPDEWVRPGQMLEGTHYLLTGKEDSKKLVVCVPGINGDHSYYEYLAPALESEGYRVLRYDLTGRGFSEPMTAQSILPPRGCFGGGNSNVDPYSLEGHVAQLHKLIKGLDLLAKHGGVFHLIGFSLGGAIAMGYADTYPDDIASITLFSPPGLLESGIFKLLRRLPCCILKLVSAVLKKNQENAWRNEFLIHNTTIEEKTIARRKIMMHQNKNSWNAILRTILAFPMSGLEPVVRHVAAARPPILLCWSLWDRTVPYDPYFDRWRSLLKTGSNVRYEIVDDASHAVLLEKPEKVNNAVLRFLKAPPTFLPAALVDQISSSSATITI